MKTEGDSNDFTERSHDGKTRPCLCTVCDRRFTLKTRLNDHKLRHGGDKLYSCTHCQKSFTNQDCLNKHMNVHSSKYKCTECGKCFVSILDLRRHRRIHFGEKPFECSVCNDLHGRTVLLYTAEFTVERNRTNVTCVTRRLVGL